MGNDGPYDLDHHFYPRVRRGENPGLARRLCAILLILSAVWAVAKGFITPTSLLVEIEFRFLPRGRRKEQDIMEWKNRYLIRSAGRGGRAVYLALRASTIPFVEVEHFPEGLFTHSSNRPHEA